jgi:hypothetical protein
MHFGIYDEISKLSLGSEMQLNLLNMRFILDSCNPSLLVSALVLHIA